MSLPLENVREQLLRAGIPPRVAGRYVTELREHLIDLTDRERKAGCAAAAAIERAKELLGTEVQLTQAMIERAPRALAARAPWAVFGLAPLLALIAAVAAIDIWMFRLLEPIHAAWPGGIPNTYVGSIGAASVLTGYILGPLLAILCMVIAVRQRLYSHWVWIGLGSTTLVSSLIGFHMNVVPPIGGNPGGAVFSLFPYIWVNGRVSESATLESMALRFISQFAVASLALLCLRRRISRRYA